MLNYKKEDIVDYRDSLSKLGALSNLFSESDIPYLHYRTTEYLYCRIFGAENLSRSDIAIDAKIGNIGVGVKTFTYSGLSSTEKIAEFNKKMSLFSGSDPLERIIAVSSLRNDRIDFVARTYGIEKNIYHCIGRSKGRVFVFEVPMDRIDIESIKILSVKGNVTSFKDTHANYSFNMSKSTLYKVFTADNLLVDTEVEIYDDPFLLIKTLDLGSEPEEVVKRKTASKDAVVLPLYGLNQGENFVYPRSGLNQWNAGGRKRAFEEVYIPIPSSVRKKAHDILPPSNTPFSLILPDGNELTVKVCQDDGKALMSNPNIDLGNWLLRDVLGLEEGEVLTYEHLLKLGIDSVEITRFGSKYKIDFMPPGTFEEYIKNI